MTDLEEKALALYWKGWEFGWDNPYNLAASILGLLFAPPEMRESLLPYSRLKTHKPRTKTLTRSTPSDPIHQQSRPGRTRTERRSRLL
jgi:hypothetical protein